MPNFESMKKHQSPTYVGNNIKEMSNMVMNETFRNSTGYRNGKIYDCNMKYIKDIDFKFLKTQTYTINKDQVEYWVQFRPGINPEIDFKAENIFDYNYRFGYYLDILDENSKKNEKWLIVGKDNDEFDKYLVLKCNWIFEWLTSDRKYYRCLGVVRDRNNYNSGVWSDGATTTVQNQTSFIIPTNDSTRTIDYGIRFMITDNTIHPKVYEITKLMDTFPMGVTHVVLAQTHYDSNKDICKVFDIKDGNGEIMHMICDYFTENTEISVNQIENPNWTLSQTNDKLYINGYSQTIKAINKSPLVKLPSPHWHISIDGSEYIKDLDPEYSSSTDTFIENYYNYKDGKSTSYYLQDYLDIYVDYDNFEMTLFAKNKDFAGYLIKIEIYNPSDKTIYYDSAEMEVCN